jgi:hypothetical protein
MSETADMNRDPNFERMLREITPERLEVSRDELFFQAGFAAGARNRSRRLIWPAIAAGLLVACGGLAAGLLRERTELTAAIAAAEHVKTPVVVGSNDGAKPQAAVALADNGLTNERRRDWRWLISSAPMPPGRLTAGGWQEARAEPGNVQVPMGNDAEPRPLGSGADSSTPHRPATYRELMQRYQEG